MKKLILAMLVGTLTSVAVSTAAWANEIELSISEELIDLRLTADYEKDFSGRLAYLHTSDEIDTDMLSYTFLTRGQMDRFNIMLGARLFWMDAERNDGYGIALGGGVSTEIIDKLVIGGELFYSPDVITGRDIQNTLEADTRASYQIVENGAVFAGFRLLKIDPERGGSVDIYENVYLGIKFTF